MTKPVARLFVVLSETMPETEAHGVAARIRDMPEVHDVGYDYSGEVPLAGADERLLLAQTKRVAAILGDIYEAGVYAREFSNPIAVAKTVGGISGMLDQGGGFDHDDWMPLARDLLLTLKHGARR